MIDRTGERKKGGGRGERAGGLRMGKGAGEKTGNLIHFRGKIAPKGHFHRGTFLSC